jgi:hypothetical protein
MSRGWRLTGAAWRLMRQDPTMVGLAFLGTGCGLVGAVLMLYLGGVFSPNHFSRAHFSLIVLLFLYPLTFVGVFFNVALTAAASAALEGRWIGLDGALREAWKRAGRIAQWALLSAVVGFVLNQIASRLPLAGRIVAWFVGVAWGIATIFAIPLLTLEDPGPIEAARGSAHLIRSKWGEGLTGIVSISAWTTLAMIPVLFAGIVGLAIAKNDPLVGIGLMVVSVTAFVSIAAAANATRQVFNLALFRYATGVNTPGFAVADFEDPFLREGGKQRTRKWAWVALSLVVGLIALGAIFGHHRGTADATPGDWYVSFAPSAASELRPGTPVVYHGRTVGTVFEVRPEGSEIRIGYHSDPTLPGEGGGPIVLVGGRSPFLRLGP